MRIEDTDPARHAAIEYPMEVSAPVFAPIKVLEEKDKAVNIARQNAQRLLDRRDAEQPARSGPARSTCVNPSTWYRSARCFLGGERPAAERVPFERGGAGRIAVGFAASEGYARTLELCRRTLGDGVEMVTKFNAMHRSGWRKGR